MKQKKRRSNKLSLTTTYKPHKFDVEIGKYKQLTSIKECEVISIRFTDKSTGYNNTIYICPSCKAIVDCSVGRDWTVEGCC